MRRAPVPGEDPGRTVPEDSGRRNGPIAGAAQMPRNNPFEKIQFELSAPPEGISLKEVSRAQDGMEIVLECDAAKVKPGLKGNLIVNIIGERMPPAGNARGPANRQRIPLGTLPAIPFEIIQR